MESAKDVVRASRIPDKKARDYIEYVLNVPIHRFTDHKSYLEAGCKNVWATFRSAHLIASMVQSTVYHLSYLGDDDREVRDRTALAYLDQANPFDSWGEILYQTVFHLVLTGEAYWLKDEMNGLGEPTYLYPLVPHFMRKETNPGGIANFQYRVNGKTINYSTEEIVYFRRPHPMRPLEGMGDIAPSEALYNNFINRNTYQEQFIEQGAAPSGVLTLKEADVDEDEWGKLKAMWKKEYAGKGNIGKTAMLTGDWTYQQLGLTQAEMQTLESEKQNVQQIFMNHGVPLSVAGVEKATSLATARQDEINFRRYTVLPLIRMIVQKLNQPDQLFALFDPQIKLGYEVSGLVNVAQIVEDYLPIVKMGGMTLNELREHAGLERLDNPFLDQHFIQNGFVPIEMAGLTNIPPDDEQLKQIISQSLSS